MRFLADGRVEVRHGWTEMGQGVHTVALQVAAQELGIDPAPHRGHRRHHPRARLRPDHRLAGHADGRRFGRSRRAAPRWPTAAPPTSTTRASTCVDWTQKLGDPDEPNPTIHSAFGYAAQLVVIDRDTGKIDSVVAVHDVGRAVNPQLCEGQIEGSVHMGLGYALDRGLPRPTPTPGSPPT